MSSPHRNANIILPTSKHLESKRALFPIEYCGTFQRNNSLLKVKHGSNSDGSKSPLYVSLPSSDLVMSPTTSSSPARYDSSFELNPNLDSPTHFKYCSDYSNPPLLNVNFPYRETSPTSSIIIDSDDLIIIPETPEKTKQIVDWEMEEDIGSVSGLPVVIKSSLVQVKRSVSLPDLNGSDRDLHLYEKSPKIFTEKLSSPEISPAAGSRPVTYPCSKHSNVRSALFTEEKKLMCSPKSFYPKTDPTLKQSRVNVYPKPLPLNTLSESKRNVITKRLHSPNKRSRKRQFGEINFGVWHKIKKPKLKKSIRDRVKAIITATSIMDNSPLNSYMNSLPVTKLVAVNEEFPSAITKQAENTIHVSPSAQSPRSAFTNNFRSSCNMTKTSIPLLALATVDTGKTESVRHNKIFKSSSRMFDRVQKIGKNASITVSKETRTSPPCNMDFSIVSENDNTIQMVHETVSEILEEWTEMESTETTTFKPDPVSVEMLNQSTLNKTQLDIEMNNKTSNNTTTSRTNDELLTSTTTSQDTSMSAISRISDTTTNMGFGRPEGSTLPRTDKTSNGKLFPLFYKGNCQAPVDLSGSLRQKKVWRPIGNDQYQIDAGQVKFGMTQCPECTVVYQIGDPEDEILHSNYHNATHVLKFKGWRKEKVVSTVLNLGRILHVTSSSRKDWHSKVTEILKVVDRELGIESGAYENKENAQIFLMADARQITGLLMASPLQTAHKNLPLDGMQCCSVNSYPVKCGVSRIWVHGPHRRKGIALALLNALRCNFIFGHIMETADIAFSCPTPDGAEVARKFTGGDEYMVYSSF